MLSIIAFLLYFQSLNVSNSTFVDAKKNTIVVSLSKLRNLSSLNVSGTEFNRTSLEMIMEDLPMLENLDVSNTKVRDISSLLKVEKHFSSFDNPSFLQNCNSYILGPNHTSRSGIERKYNAVFFFSCLILFFLIIFCIL